MDKDEESGKRTTRNRCHAFQLWVDESRLWPSGSRAEFGLSFVRADQMNTSRMDWQGFKTGHRATLRFLYQSIVKSIEFPYIELI
jgi:hypothetical protein